MDISLLRVRDFTRPYIIWWAILLHVVWGVSILFRPSIITLGILVGINRLTDVGLSSMQVGSVLLIAALLALIALILDHRIPRHISISLLAPQYFILVLAFISDIEVLYYGEVRNQSVDRIVLFTVLFPVMIGAVLHTLAIYERYTRWTVNTHAR